jgi:hypothetical protein
MQVWRNCQVLSEQTSDSSAFRDTGVALLYNSYWSVFLLRTSCNLQVSNIRCMEIKDTLRKSTRKACENHISRKSVSLFRESLRKTYTHEDIMLPTFRIKWGKINVWDTLPICPYNGPSYILSPGESGRGSFRHLSADICLPSSGSNENVPCWPIFGVIYYHRRRDEVEKKISQSVTSVASATYSPFHCVNESEM